MLKRTQKFSVHRRRDSSPSCFFLANQNLRNINSKCVHLENQPAWGSLLLKPHREQAQPWLPRAPGIKVTLFSVIPAVSGLPNLSQHDLGQGRQYQTVEITKPLPWRTCIKQEQNRREKVAGSQKDSLVSFKCDKGLGKSVLSLCLVPAFPSWHHSLLPAAHLIFVPSLQTPYE